MTRAAGWEGALDAQLAHGAGPLDDDGRARLVDLLVDAVGLAVAGATSPAARAAARALGGSTLPDRVCLDGTAIHALDFDDTHEQSLCHTGAVLVPVLLRLGAHAHAPGPLVLEAYAAGLALVDHLAPLGPRLNTAGVHSTAILGALGGAVAAATVLGLDDAQRVATVELAATMAAGLCVSFGTDTKPLQAGRAAETAVRAALLVREGFGAPTGAVLGPRGLLALLLGDDALETLPPVGPRTEAIAAVGIKPYPSCLLTHTPIDLALEARSRLELSSVEEVDTIMLSAHPIVGTLADKTDLRRDLDAKFSVRYCLLAALADGDVVSESFETPARERLTGTGWDTWSRGVDLRLDVESRLAARLVVRTVDGRELVVEAPGPRGAPGRPLDALEVRTKFLRAVSGTRGEAAAHELLSRVESLADIDDVAQLGEVLP
ncbi:MmgE/PrpD family protein [Aeromicrobium wangtongii]|uniref:MmgE/PrpD family protein n=1 Tax=Aeromicrobium wangtongii TaxID=2969247 RepID=UPI002016B938|nr:MmgE/PrpD family protein [Aeromicrobium wangtongii]MCL3819381.1 MmgE/PrpD family protein [Aeromicrobium wangtongii]